MTADPTPVTDPHEPSPDARSLNHDQHRSQHPLPRYRPARGVGLRTSTSNTVARLKKVEEKRALSTAEQDELDLSEEILDEITKSRANNSKADEVCDPLFVATRTLLNEQSLIDDELRTHLDGVLVFETSAQS